PLTLLTNARIVGQPQLQNLRFHDGMIQEIGPRVAAPHEEVIDLEGAFLCPGLWDTHIHLSLCAQALLQLDLSGCRSRDECLERIAQRARDTDEPWIQGFGWAESDWPDPRRPTLEELDRVSEGKPVFLARSDLHSAIANSAALRLAGIDEQTPDPSGGVFEKDGDGRLNGHLLDMALHEVRHAIPEPGQDAVDRGLLQAVARLHQWGIVGVCDQRLKDHPDGPIAWETYRRIAPRPRIHCNLAAHQI
ncbi:unnamed protein product, partial [Phaeothamnion confervicola]